MLCGSKVRQITGEKGKVRHDGWDGDRLLKDACLVKRFPHVMEPLRHALILLFDLYIVNV